MSQKQTQQKPTIDNIRAYMQSGIYEQKRREIQSEINLDKVSIDRECFAKTKDEKLDSKIRKSIFVKNGNSQEFKNSFGNSIPNWGDTSYVIILDKNGKKATC